MSRTGITSYVYFNEPKNQGETTAVEEQLKIMRGHYCKYLIVIPLFFPRVPPPLLPP